MKKVRTIDEIIFEKADPPVTLPKGMEFEVVQVKPEGIILRSGEEDWIQIDLNTFEAGFEAI